MIPESSQLTKHTVSRQIVGHVLFLFSNSFNICRRFLRHVNLIFGINVASLISVERIIVWLVLQTPVSKRVRIMPSLCFLKKKTFSGCYFRYISLLLFYFYSRVTLTIKFHCFNASTKHTAKSYNRILYGDMPNL